MSSSSFPLTSNIRLLSASENLVERLRLAVEESCNGPTKLTPADVTTVTERISAQLFDQRLQCDWCGASKWIMLVGKEFDQEVMETLGCVYRWLASQPPTSRLLVVKNELNHGDRELLAVELASLKAKWTREWTSLWEKFQRMAPTDARNEYLAKLDTWRVPPPIKWELLQLEDAEDVVRKAIEFLQLGDGKCHPTLLIGDCGSEAQGKEKTESWKQLTTKPPALHWTPTPREAELQVSFKFTFPNESLTSPLIRRLCSALRGAHAWDYDYEWTGGVFLRPNELVKITLAATEATNAAASSVLELAGRIDVDEAELEEEEDADDTISTKSPLSASHEQRRTRVLNKVWPYFVRALDALMHVLDDDLVSLPYQLNLIFIGERFFTRVDESRAERPISTITSRSLDAVQSLGAIERAGAVRFKVGEVIYALRLEECFPGFRPTSMAHFTPGNFPLPNKATAKSEVNSGEDSTHPPLTISFSATLLGTTTSETATATANDTDHDSRSLTPRQLLPNPHGLQVDRQRLGAGAGGSNRGRRVSFGAIRSIPALQQEMGSSRSGPGSAHLMRQSSGSLSPMMRARLDEKSAAEAGPSASAVIGQKVSESGADTGHDKVDVYVEEMLRKAIGEVLVDVDEEGL